MPPQAGYEIWTPDILHSAIYANCSSPARPDVETLTSFATSRQAFLSFTTGTGGDRTAAYQQYLGLREALAQCLPGDVLRDASDARVEATRHVLSQQPAAMRLKSSKQPLTVPSGLGGASAAGSGNSTAGAFADGFYYVPQQGDGDAAPVPELLLRPGAAFDVSVQLYDIVGLPIIAGKRSGLFWRGNMRDHLFTAECDPQELQMVLA